MKKTKSKKQMYRNKKVKKTKKLSICIVGKDKEEFIEKCIDSSLKLSSNIAYLDLGSSDKSVEIAKRKRVKVTKNEPSLAWAESLEKSCNSDWIIFLRPDEQLAFESTIQFDRILTRGIDEGAYSFIVKKVVEPELLEAYQWVKSNEQYRYAENKIYVSTVEIRLVRRRNFHKFLTLMVTRSKEDLFALDSKIISEVQIKSCQREKPKEHDPAKEKKRQIKYIKGEISLNPEKDDGLGELGDDFIGFSVLSKKDLDGFYKGLSMGFGSERMYLGMLNYLGKFGKFEDARDFFEAWQDKWIFFNTPEPYRIGGLIYINLFELDKALSCFKKYIKFVSKDLLPEILSTLAKIYLLQGKKQKVIHLLKRSLKLEHDKFNEVLLNSITTNNWKPAKLSVCIIAKNEGASIRKTLESIYELADEVIVVDTGSTDNTKEIAREFNGTIIDALWEDDFSEARNLGLSAATGDYILCLDADEFIDSRARIGLAMMKHILPIKHDIAFRVSIEPEEEDEEMAVMLRLQDFKLIQHPVRLFPAHKKIRFEGTAFEKVDESIRLLGIKIKDSNLFKITHANLDRKVRDRRKKVAVCNSFDSIYDPEIAMKGVSYFLKLGQLDTALKWLEKADIDNPLLLAKIVELYSRGSTASSVIPLIDKAAERFPDSIELRVAKAELSLSDGMYEEVCSTMAPHMETIRETLSRADCAKASFQYGLALLETGDIEKGLEYLVDARNDDPWNIRYKMGGIYALTRCGEWEVAIEAVNDLLRAENLDLGMTIDDFADLGVIFSRLSRHFFGKNRKDSADLCQRILEDIIENRLTKKAEIEKMTEFLNEPDKFWEEDIHA